MASGLSSSLLLTSRRQIMGTFTNTKWTRYAGWVVEALAVAPNLTLLYMVFSGYGVFGLRPGR